MKPSNGFLQAQKAHTFILDRIADWDLKRAWQDISRLTESAKGSLADIDHLSLALYWALALRRYPAKQTIQMQEQEYEHIITLPEYPLVKQYTLTRGLQLPAGELAHLTLLLSTSLRHGSTSPSPADVVATAQDLTTRLIQKIDPRISGSQLTSDVVSRLEAHLARSITRLQYGVPIHNSLTDEVRRAYPDLWRTVEAALKEEQPAFSKDEVAFVTMYMALAAQLLQKAEQVPRVLIACPTGGITVRMLLYRLQKELPELQIIDVISIRQLSEIDSHVADAVISTAKIPSQGLPVITISPFVNEEDLEVLRKQLNLTH
jgi:mannitol operon transcriptional antiterminator